MNQLTLCRVCGFDFVHYYPWGADGKIPTYDICPCCNVEFGYEDHTIESTLEYRNKWISMGAKFNKPNVIDLSNWNFENQLKNLLTQPIETTKKA